MNHLHRNSFDLFQTLSFPAGKSEPRELPHLRCKQEGAQSQWEVLRGNHWWNLIFLFFNNIIYFQEAEYERRVRKRRAKLVTATEEAFAHIKRMSADQMKGDANNFSVNINLTPHLFVPY